MRRTEWFASLGHDVRYATRQLRRGPTFAAAVSLTLALGIGANAAMFGVVDRLLLRAPAGVAQPENVSRLYFTRTFSWAGTVTGAFTSYGDYVQLRDHLHDIAGIAIYGRYATSMGRGPDARQVWRTLATPSYFRVLGVRPVIGRFFTENEERIPLGEAVAVLSYGYWQRELGGDPSVLGRRIQLGARTYRIIGVAPRDFTGVELQPTDVWVPFSAAASEMGGDEWYRPGRWTGPTILVRLSPTVERSLIAAQATTIFRHTLEETERSPSGGAYTDSSARVTLGSIVVGRAPAGARESGPQIAVWLSAMSVLVLLIACGNVINLLLARAASRRGEIAVRLALGAGRRRIVKQLLVDSVLLVMIGGGLGLALGASGDVLLRRLLIPDGTTGSVVDGRLLLFTLTVTAAAALLTGMVPALIASRPELTNWLKTSREGRYLRSRTRDAMLLLQATLSVVLLVGAGLFVRSLHSVLSVDLGYDAPHIAVASVDFSNTSFKRPEIDAFYRNAAARLRGIPGIAETALTTAIPFWSSSAVHLVVPGRERLPVTKDGGPYIAQVTAEYFATARTRIVRGRGFTSADGPGAPRVAVVSETMARLIWPGEDALGKCLKVGADSAPCSSVVGIARDARRQALEDIPVMQYYVPLDQHQSQYGEPAVVVRTSGEPGALVPAIRRTMSSIVPDLPFVDVRPLQTLIDPRIQPWRTGAGVFAAFGLLALLIASVGLYSVIGYEVTQRMHEFGVRVALGATRQRIVALVLRRGIGLTIIGVVLGVAMSLAGASWLEPLLFQTSATDASVFVVVVASLLVVALVACVVPARHAAMSDPARALRAE